MELKLSSELLDSTQGQRADRAVAVVSGGSRGIGRATVVELAKRGWDVAFSYLNDSAAAATTAEMAEAAGARVHATRCDVSQFAQVQGWLELVESRFGEVDQVINSAGITRDGPLLMMEESDWHAVIDTNLTGVFNVCRVAMFPMLKRRRGGIVNLSSISGISGNPTQTNYAASKAGIIGFSKSLSKEVGPYGIRVNVVAPGFIETDMTSKLTSALQEKFIKSVPLRRMGQAQEVAALVAFLASQDAAYITGQVFGIDGGLVI